MPLTPNATITQSLAYPTQLTFTDTSTGSDGTIVTRRVFVITATGKWLTTSGESSTEAYELWPYPIGTPITLAVLSKNTAPSIRIEWWDSGAKVYEKIIVGTYNLFGYVFGYNLTRDALSDPSVVGVPGYYLNKFTMLTELENSETAISYSSDIYNAQKALDRAQPFIDNRNTYF